jgi:hypothetical protein
MYAYPYQHRHPTTGVTTMSEGMTLRDYFAAKAMQGLTQQGQRHLATIAKDAYDMADVMLKVREGKHD